MSEPIDPYPGTATRRAAERRPCFLEVALADKLSAFREARVVELSAGGALLLVDPPPAPGEKLVLTFLRDDSRLYQIPATVIHHLDHERTRAVGCQFARELDDKEIAAIL